jgi:protein O-mannosyl-transferase
MTGLAALAASNAAQWQRLCRRVIFSCTMSRASAANPTRQRNENGAASRDRWRTIAAGAAIVLLTVIAYIPAILGGFVWDDDAYVEHNPTLRSLEGLWRIWTDWHATPQFYPLVHTSFWIEYHVWTASSALGYHLVNVLLHAASAILLWHLLRRLHVGGAWLIAAVFAVHPINAESVAWITERKNVLSGLFYLLAFGAYLRAIDLDSDAVTPPLKKWLVPFAFFVLALLSKTVTATLPAAILLVIWWKRGRLSFRRDVVPLIPFFIVGLAMSSVTGHLERTQVGAHGPEWSSLTPVDRVLIAGRAVWFYFAKICWPHPLIFIHPRWLIDPHLWWQWFFPAGVILSLVALWLARNRIGRGPLTATLFFIGTLVPALGFVNVFPMRYSFVAEHFAYLASIGPIALVGAAIAGRSRLVVGVIIVPLLAAITFQHSFVFHDRQMLWRDTLARNPSAWIAHSNLGHIYRATGRNDDAWREYQAALALAPNVPDTHLDIATQLAQRGEFDSALAECKKVIAIDPTYAGVYVVMAKFYLAQGNPNAAEQIVRQALVVEPKYPMAHYMLARALQQQGRLDDAAGEYFAALALNPDNAEAHFHLADTLVQLRQGQAAIEHYRASLEIDPDNAPAWTTLGNLMLASGQPVAAADCFRRALAIDPQLKPAQDGLRRAGG